VETKNIIDIDSKIINSQKKSLPIGKDFYSPYLTHQKMKAS
jgi:hypothetical protein